MPGDEFKSEMVSSAFALGTISVTGDLLSTRYLMVAMNVIHASSLNASSGLFADLVSRTRTLPPSWPTSTHAPPLPPLRVDLRHRGSRVSIARSPLFGSGRGMPPWGVLPIVPARTCRASWLPGSGHR